MLFSVLLVALLILVLRIEGSLRRRKQSRGLNRCSGSGEQSRERGPCEHGFCRFRHFTFSSQFGMRCGTPSESLCASWIANLAARADQTSFCCEFGVPSNAKQRSSVPLNESLESPEGFRDSYCGLDFKTGRACRGRTNTDQMFVKPRVLVQGMRVSRRMKVSKICQVEFEAQ